MNSMSGKQLAKLLERNDWIIKSSRQSPYLRESWKLNPNICANSR